MIRLRHWPTTVANEKGQAIFELIIFLPFLVFLATVFLTLGDSLNASINQQKVTRRYYFGILRGNSRVPDAQDLNSFESVAIRFAGMSSLGWKNKFISEQPYAACFKMNTPIDYAKNEDETCDEPIIEEGRTEFVRIYTFYGICGQSYSAGANNKLRVEPRRFGSNSCLLTN